MASRSGRPFARHRTLLRELARAPDGRWRVYVLRCGDGSLYTGITNDLARRLAQHGAGDGARYTRARLPVELVHHERARDRSAALRREAAIKRMTRAEKLALIARRRDRGRAGPRQPA